MLVNLKEIIVINLFYNLPYFLFNLPTSNSKFRVHTPYGLSKFKKIIKIAIYDKEFWPRWESNRRGGGHPAW